ncbi:MAG: bifunctional folylpolyglutamate synthase/dihydrofolate synthase [Pseudomonadales bacterium]|nr:bifunctional folylpolyglutamate synthase/dihydrofolate synthase [Pseudomonadales bacterium]
MANTSSRSLPEWLSYIEALHPEEIEMGLERIKSVYQRLPQFPDQTQIIMVAGTNGKGSTVRSVEALATATGLSVGAYTSPHIIRYNERVQVNLTPVEDKQLVDAFERVEQARGDTELTYFEFGTLAAFIILAEACVDLAVLEIGLGGRLDAVNIVDPDVAIITSIAMDHESWLGNTREAIGREKAGIIRKNQPVICGDIDPPETVSEACKKASKSYFIGDDFGFERSDENQFHLHWRHKQLTPSATISVDLPVLPQNLLMAIQAMGVLGENISQADIEAALPNMAVAGRQQWLSKQPWVMVDVGHNPQAARALAQRLMDEKKLNGIDRVICILAMLADKQHSNTLAELLPAIDVWVPCDLQAGFRSQTADPLVRVLQEAGAHVDQAHRAPAAAYRSWLPKLGEKDLLVVFGSFFTVADILPQA